MADILLDQQVRIEYQGTSTDAVYGVQPGAWTALETVWGKVDEVLPVRAQERGAELRIASKIVRVTIRWRSDVDSSMRIVLVDRDGRLLRIVAGPAEIERRKYLHMLCEEFTTEGNAA